MTWGCLAGAWVGRWQAGRLGLDARHALPLLLVVVPAGILGARIYYLVFEWERRFEDEPELAWQIWEGGVALHGALAGGLLAMAIYARLRRLDLLRWLDAAALGFPLGGCDRALGRLLQPAVVRGADGPAVGAIGR